MNEQGSIGRKQIGHRAGHRRKVLPGNVVRRQRRDHHEHDNCKKSLHGLDSRRGPRPRQSAAYLSLWWQAYRLQNSSWFFAANTVAATEEKGSCRHMTDSGCPMSLPVVALVLRATF